MNKIWTGTTFLLQVESRSELQLMIFKSYAAWLHPGTVTVKLIQKAFNQTKCPMWTFKKSGAILKKGMPNLFTSHY